MIKSIIYTFVKSDHWGPQVHIMAYPLTPGLSKWKSGDLYELLDPHGVGVTGRGESRKLLKEISEAVAGLLALGGYSVGNWHVLDGVAGIASPCAGGLTSFYKTIYLNQPCQSTPTRG